MYSSVMVGLSVLSAPLTPADVFPPIPVPLPPPSVTVHPNTLPPHRVQYVWPPLCSHYNIIYHGPFAGPDGAPAPIPPAGGDAGALPKPKEKILYERIGGEPAIRALVEDLVARAAADPKVNFTRKGTPAEWNPTPDNLAQLKKHLVELIGMATGGPQKYTGKNMADAHRGMKITRAEFDALKSDLKASLDQLKVPEAEQAELLKIADGMAADIVEKSRN